MIHTGLPRHSTVIFSPGFRAPDVDLDRGTGGLGALGRLEVLTNGTAVNAPPRRRHSRTRSATSACSSPLGVSLMGSSKGNRLIGSTAIVAERFERIQSPGLTALLPILGTQFRDRPMSIVKVFREFAIKGNVIDLAVA
jgi:hypothetical protein